MSQPPLMRVPDWVKPEQRQLFVLRLAAVYHNEAGSIREMSAEIGAGSTLHMALSSKGLTAEHCIALEGLLGREHFPREFFRPDIFVPA